MDFSDQLRGLIEAQDGLVHRRQLLEAGVTPSALRWHLGRRRQLVLPGVAATVTGTLTPRQRLVAGQLMAGPEAVISGPTAAAWHGILEAARDGRVRAGGRPGGGARDQQCPAGHDGQSRAADADRRAAAHA